MIDTLMIFAAGFGKRMQPITNTIPKPLVEVAGKPMLYHALDLAASFAFKQIIINSHHLAELVEQAVERYIKLFQPKAQIKVVREEQILETGGGIKNVSQFLAGKQAIFTMNSDSVIAADGQIWQSMIDAWRPEEMDFLMLSTPCTRSFGSVGKGDFNLDANGILNKNLQSQRFDFMFSGLQILKPKLIIENSAEVFSLASYYQDARYRLRGFINPGKFYHISSVDDWQNLKDENLFN